MKRQILEVITAILLVLLSNAVSVAQRRSPGRTVGQSARDGGGRNTQRRPAEGLREKQRAASTDENDADFQRFFEYIPLGKWREALQESSYVERRGGRQQEFQYQELNYPKGDKNPTSYRFDMGPTSAPVASDYIKITSHSRRTSPKTKSVRHGSRGMARTAPPVLSR